MTLFEEIAKDIINSRREILGSENVDLEHESFGISLIPCTFPSSWGFEIINVFSIILKGLLTTKDKGGLVSILQTDCPIGGENEFSHNFFISSIPDITWRSSFGTPVINVFTFVHGSTSGYPGSGPQVHEEIYKLMVLLNSLGVNNKPSFIYIV